MQEYDYERHGLRNNGKTYCSATHMKSGNKIAICTDVCTNGHMAEGYCPCHMSMQDEVK